MDNKENFDLNGVFNEHYQYCVNWLMAHLKCQKQDAEDCFMDALVKLQMQVKNNTFKQINLRGWLVTVAKNIYLSTKTSKYKIIPIDVDKAEAYLSEQKGIYDASFNPLLKTEILNELKTDEKNRIAAYQKAYSNLGAACKKILDRLKEGVKLKNLTEELGYASYNSLKTTKARCLKNLKKHTLNLMNNKN